MQLAAGDKAVLVGGVIFVPVTRAAAPAPLSCQRACQAGAQRNVRLLLMPVFWGRNDDGYVMDVSIKAPLNALLPPFPLARERLRSSTLMPDITLPFTYAAPHTVTIVPSRYT